MDDFRTKETNKEKQSGQIILIDQAHLGNHLDKLMRGTVEETLNALPKVNKNRLCLANSYERT